jgi:hypothetical protein
MFIHILSNFRGINAEPDLVIGVAPARFAPAFCKQQFGRSIVAFVPVLFSAVVQFAFQLILVEIGFDLMSLAAVAARLLQQLVPFMII